MRVRYHRHHHHHITFHHIKLNDVILYYKTTHQIICSYHFIKNYITSWWQVSTCDDVWTYVLIVASVTALSCCQGLGFTGCHCLSASACRRGVWVGVWGWEKCEGGRSVSVREVWEWEKCECERSVSVREVWVWEKCQYERSVCSFYEEKKRKKKIKSNKKRSHL